MTFMLYIKRYALLTVGLLMLFCALMLAVHTVVPHCAIDEHVKSSAQQLHNEGNYPQHFSCYCYMQDNFTDAVMLNIAYCAPDDDIVTGAFQPSFAATTDNMTGELQNLVTSSADANQNMRKYGRYWHGNQVILRLLLVLTDYEGIRILNAIALTLLLVVTALLFYRHFSWFVMAMYAGSMLFVMFPVVYCNMQYVTCFYITFIALLVLFRFPKLCRCNLASSSFLFVVGACTSFFDLLTTPLLTLCFPLMTLMLQRRQEGRDAWKSLFVLSFSWGLGYALLWALKWAMVPLLTGDNIMQSVFYSVRLRSLGGEVQPGGESYVVRVLTGYYRSRLVQLLLAVFALISLVHVFSTGDRKLMKRYAWILGIVAMMPLWFMVFMEHSVRHLFFTWRSMAVLIFSFFTYICLTLKKRGMKHG